ncbi:G-protein coupled receptor Mth2 [Fopius arisanus]|uniref:G-protein coupled receptor Mth2 n=1 Tax=Fopius arisanus TaxID=64838 RepID=A0A0C9RBM2_9HYME|nr:PREDICTED: G-protein coupled receptor Mth2-like [Fopius arisanus]
MQYYAPTASFFEEKLRLMVRVFTLHHSSNMWITRAILMIIFISIFQGDDVEGSEVSRNHGVSRARRSLVPSRKSQVSICCPPGTYLTTDYSTCSSNSSSPIYDLELPQIFTSKLLPSEKGPDDFEKIYGIPCTFVMYELDWEEPWRDEFYLMEDGRIFINQSRYNPESEYLEIDDYCIGNWMDDNGTSTKVFGCYSLWLDKYFWMLNTCSVLPMPFLAATFLVYVLLPELRNIHGIILMMYIASLFWTKLGISLLRFQVITADNSQTLCTFTGFVVFFWFLSSFFWLNVMCIDIWSTFRGSRVIQSKKKTQRKFILYSIYAWGFPSIMTGSCIIMDYAPNIPENYIKPNIGEYMCWFQDDRAESLYFYFPVSITVICNFSLFVSTTVKIIRHRRQIAKQLNASGSRRHADRQQRFNLYIKLFVVMGINWFFDVVTWTIGHQNHHGWYLEEFLDSIQGVMIFVIFVCKGKIIKRLMWRFQCRRRNENRAV